MGIQRGEALQDFASTGEILISMVIQRGEALQDFASNGEILISMVITEQLILV
jgi:hypothetical protein